MEIPFSARTCGGHFEIGKLAALRLPHILMGGISIMIVKSNFSALDLNRLYPNIHPSIIQGWWMTNFTKKTANLGIFRVFSNNGLELWPWNIDFRAKVSVIMFLRI